MLICFVMDRQKVIILGAGISGLSCAWYLRRLHPDLKITVLESSHRVGGWIHSDHTTGFHFEKGPRTFLASRTPKVLSLIADLGIEDQIIFSKAEQRYLFLEGNLHQIPTNPLQFLTSQLMRGVIKALFFEWKRPRVSGDESVFDFVKRRFNTEVASLLFDPLVVGIFGGDSRTISVRACFPGLKSLEEIHGSITKGLWHQWKNRENTEPSRIPRTATYSLQQGAQAITETLHKNLKSEIRLNREVDALLKDGNHWKVFLKGGECFEADHLISALPLKAARSLFAPLAPDLITSLSDIELKSLVIVNMGYRENVLKRQGFGYLTQSRSGSDVLGVIFDSSVFPQHNHREEETRLTLLLKEKGLVEDGYISTALKGLKESLHITKTPDSVAVKLAHEAIPQYQVGYLDRMASFEKAFEARVFKCHLVGNYLSGVSIESCVERAKRIAEKVSENLPRELCQS